MKLHSFKTAQGLVIASLLLATPAGVFSQILFSDDFDTDTSGSYTINKSSADTLAEFEFDYSAVGIPSAPNSIGGSTLGLKLKANVALPNSGEAINLSPTGGSFTGNYRMQFDMWINVNGPLPGGGAGSTEFVTAGVGVTATKVQSTLSGSTAEGAWFAVDGEGGSSIDFRAMRGTSIQTAATGAYAAGTGTAPDARNSSHPYYHTTYPGGQMAPSLQQTMFPGPTPGMDQTGSLAIGTVGFGWRQVVISKVGPDVFWEMDGLLIATLRSAAMPGNNIFVGYQDIFTTSTSDNPDMSFGLIDNLVVEVPEPTTWMLGLLGGTGLFFMLRRRK